MNRKEHLLTIVSEECNEVGQRCSKALRFGVREKQRDQDYTNQERLLHEFNDLVATMEMLFERPITTMINPARVAEKKEKVEKYLTYSMTQGTLEIGEDELLMNNATQLLDDMLKSDRKLYERILDTPGFAYAFNELCKIAVQKQKQVSKPAINTAEGNVRKAMIEQWWDKGITEEKRKALVIEYDVKELTYPQIKRIYQSEIEGIG